jgi:CHAT domain-containing protein
LTEIRQIGELIRQQKGKTIVLEGKNATETQLKAAQIPDILHLATHGFFISSENNFINPLLKSGLVLAGVNKKTYDDNTDEDGVLTAFEIASLDLRNTKLVVLSACETGLGEVKNGDGVYGLQRAFKIAEAKYIILSMWKVDDAATMQLMTNFYSTLLKTNDVIQSFTAAQKELRKNYPSPYYWGAFKLIGY